MSRDLITDLTAHLLAAISYIEAQEECVPKSKKDALFGTKIGDYKKAAERGKAAIRERIAAEKGDDVIFAIRDSDHKMIDPQVAYYDGYGIEDRLLEDVLFKLVGGRDAYERPELVCEGVHPDAEEYCKKFSPAQMLKWKIQVTENALDGESLRFEDGSGELYWEEGPTNV